MKLLDGTHAFYKVIAILATMDIMEIYKLIPN